MRRLAILAIILLVVAGCSPAGGKSAKGADVESVVISGTAHTGGQPVCPDAQALAPTDQSDRERLLALLPQVIPALYPEPGHAQYVVGTVAPAAQAGVRGEMVQHWCGPEVAGHTWAVMLTFPQLAPSASLSSGLFFVARTRAGWEVWWQYR